MLAVAAESLVKLAAFIGVGVFVLFSVFGGFGGFLEAVRANTEIGATLRPDVQRRHVADGDVPQLLRDPAAAAPVPRHGGREPLRARDQARVVAVSALPRRDQPVRRSDRGGGPAHPAARASSTPTCTCWRCRWPRARHDRDGLAYIGGLSAATAMVVVESVALSIMVCNGLVVPLLLQAPAARRSDAARGSGRACCSIIRRIAIVVDRARRLSRLQARSARRRGWPRSASSRSRRSRSSRRPSSAGSSGAGVPRAARSPACSPASRCGATRCCCRGSSRPGCCRPTSCAMGPFGIAVLRPQALFYLAFDPLTHGVLWSMVANITAYVAVSLWRAPEPIERLQAHVFVLRRPAPRRRRQPAFRLWRTSLTVGDLQATVTRYLGAERAERSFAEYAREPQHHAEAAGGSRPADAAVHRASADERDRCGLRAARDVAAAAARQRRQPVGAEAARRCVGGAAVQPRPAAIRARPGAPRPRRVRQGHAASCAGTGSSASCWRCRRSSAASAFRSTDPAALRGAWRLRRRADRRAGRRPLDAASRCTKETFQEHVRGRQAHPGVPHLGDAAVAGRHRVHVLRHHRARRGGQRAGAGQRDAGAARQASARSTRGCNARWQRQGQGRRGQPRQDAVPRRGQPRPAAAAQRGAPVCLEPRRAATSARPIARSPATSMRR